MNNTVEKWLFLDFLTTVYRWGEQMYKLLNWCQIFSGFNTPKNWLTFERIICKIQRWTFSGTQCRSIYYADSINWSGRELNHWISLHWVQVTKSLLKQYQYDGRPAEYRWRPLFNAAKIGWRPLLECRAETLLRCESRWNLQRCPN